MGWVKREKKIELEDDKTLISIFKCTLYIKHTFENDDKGYIYIYIHEYGLRPSWTKVDNSPN